LGRLYRLEASRFGNDVTPEQREGYEQRLLRERPKNIPMKHEDVARLSPDDRQEYENSSFKNNKNI
jgi:hypothetical protein